LIDIAVLVVWYFRSPMSRKVETFDPESPENTDDDVKIQPQLEHCDANLIWYCIIFGWKGLLMIFGLFLAYETRSAKVRLINDARFVGMSVYNVVILCAITGPVSLVISNQVNAHFAFIAFTIFFCCFMSMALVFIPKISEICRRRGAHAMSANGVVTETMTTKEEEEKLERLIQENDDLRVRIADN
jgi:gamma-aminobutyric acid type B receptor